MGSVWSYISCASGSLERNSLNTCAEFMILDRSCTKCKVWLLLVDVRITPFGQELQQSHRNNVSCVVSLMSFHINSLSSGPIKIYNVRMLQT